jgi:hypothetical protein
MAVYALDRAAVVIGGLRIATMKFNETTYLKVAEFLKSYLENSRFYKDLKSTQEPTERKTLLKSLKVSS